MITLECVKTKTVLYQFWSFDLIPVFQLLKFLIGKKLQYYGIQLAIWTLNTPAPYYTYPWVPMKYPNFVPPKYKENTTNKQIYFELIQIILSLSRFEHHQAISIQLHMWNDCTHGWLNLCFVELTPTKNILLYVM